MTIEQVISNLKRAKCVPYKKAAAILNDYRVEQIYEDVERICGYLPDSILDAIVEQIEG